MSDPIAAWRKRTALVIAIGAPLSLACAMWAMRVPAMPALPHTEETRLRDEMTDELDRPEPLPQQPFLAAIWNPPPPPPPPEASSQREASRPEPPPPAIRLQLIGIVRAPDDDTGVSGLLAALYDPESDGLFLAATGDRIGAARVESIDDEAVTLLVGTRQTRLSLREAGPAPRRGGR